MLYPDIKSSNGHTVHLYGRLFFRVSSASRKGLDHFVDLERTNYPDGEGRDRYYASICTCEAWKYGERPCRHIWASFEAIGEWANIPLEHLEEWIGRLMYLLNMGRSFSDALQSDYMQDLRTKQEPEDEPRPARQYTLKMSRRKYEAPTTAKKRTERRLPARVHSKPA